MSLHEDPRHNCLSWTGIAAAPSPELDELSVNESRFEHECRFKSYSMFIEEGVGHVSWISQESSRPTEDWTNEVKRAFIANGLQTGSSIHVKFGSRSTGYADEFDIQV